VALANNDLVFGKSWFTEILNAAKGNPEVKSFGSWNDHGGWHSRKFQDPDGNYIGYTTAAELPGWLITAHREVFDIINLDDRVNFYYSDDIYGDELKKHGIKHMLVGKSKVLHYAETTLRTMPNFKELTVDQHIHYLRGK
jgi:GT2 family glycosyltransferase